MLPCCAPCQKQDGDIAASDQQEQCNRSKQQTQRASQPINKLIVESLNSCFELFRKVLRSFLRKLFQQNLELCIGGSTTHAGL